MNNSLKRLLSLLLAVIMCVSLLPVNALAEESGTETQYEEAVSAEPEAQALNDTETAEAESEETEPKENAYESEGINASLDGEQTSRITLDSLTATNKDVQLNATATLWGEGHNGCIAYYYIGLSLGIDPADPSTYMRRIRGADVAVPDQGKSFNFTGTISELVPGVNYCVVVTVEIEGFIMAQTPGIGFRTSQGNDGFTTIAAGNSVTMNGKTLYPFVFTPAESGTYGFHMYGGDCRTTAYSTAGSIISGTVFTDDNNTGNTRYIEVEAGQTVYLYAEGNTAGTGNYTLEVFTAEDGIASGTVTPGNCSATIPVTYSVTQATALSHNGSEIDIIYGTDENIDPDDDSSYIRRYKMLDIPGPAHNKTVNLDVQWLVPGVHYYYTIVLAEEVTGDIKAQGEICEFTTQSGYDGLTMVESGDTVQFDGQTDKGFVFTASESGIYKFSVDGSDRESGIYNSDGSIKECTDEIEDNGEENYRITHSVSVDAHETIFFYVRGVVAGQNNYSLTVSEGPYDEAKLRDRIEHLKETGGTVELNNDVTLTDNLVIPAGVTLNINGGTLTVPGTYRLTVSQNACINVNEGNLTIYGTLYNSGCVGKYSSGNLYINKKKPVIGNGEFYELIGSSGTITNLDISKIIAKSYVGSLTELEQFSEDAEGYLRMIAYAGSLVISENYTLPNKCTLNIVPDGQNRGELTIQQGTTLTVGNSSGLYVSSDAVVTINGTLKSGGTVSTSYYNDGDCGRIIIADGGYLESNGYTDNCGRIILSSADSEIKINEAYYSSYYNGYDEERCIEIYGITDPEADNLNGLSEELCVLCLNAEDMDELISALETDDWSCVDVSVGFSPISENINVGKGFTLRIPGEVTVNSGVEIIVAPNGQIGIEDGAKIINSGSIHVFGSIWDFGNNAQIKNTGSIKVYSDAHISSNITVTDNLPETDPKLSEGRNYGYSNLNRYEFKAGEDGWYMFSFSGNSLSGVSYCVNSGDWYGTNEPDNIPLQLSADDTVVFNAYSYSSDPELLTIDVSAMTPATDYAVTTGNATAVGNDYADLQISLSAPGGADYECGIVYAPKQSTGNLVIGGNTQTVSKFSNAPANEQTVKFTSVQVAPDTEYEYRAYIVYADNEGIAQYVYGDVKTFTTKEIDDEDCDEFTELELGTTVNPDSYAYYFDIPSAAKEDDFYIFTVDRANMQVYSGGGYYQQQLTVDGENTVILKNSPNSDRVYVYINTYGNTNCSITIEEKKSADIKKYNKLGSYVNENVKPSELYRYDIPEDGIFEISTADNGLIWCYRELANGEWSWQYYCGQFEINDADEGETIYLMLESSSNVTVRHYADNGQGERGCRLITTAEEFIDFIRNDNCCGICSIDGDITLPLPVGQKEYFYYTDKHIIIPDGSSLTVPNGVTLHLSSIFEIEDGGELIAGRGGRIENSWLIFGIGDILIEETGELQNYGKVMMQGGTLTRTGDCLNDGRILVFCENYSSNPKAALTGDDFDNVIFAKSVARASEAEEFFNQGREYGFKAVALFDSNTTLEKDLFVPLGDAIEVEDDKELTIPGGKTLIADGEISLASGAKIINSGTLKIYNDFSYNEDGALPEISNSGTVILSSNCKEIAEGLISGTGTCTDVKVEGCVAVASFEDMAKCMEDCAVAVVENITIPAGNYRQDNYILITNGAELKLAANAKIESSSVIKIINSTLDIAAQGAEINKLGKFIMITGPKARFWAMDKSDAGNPKNNFKADDSMLGVLYDQKNGTSIGAQTDLPKSKISLYREVGNKTELETAIGEASDGWKYVLADCFGSIELKASDYGKNNPLVIPENAVIGIYENNGGKLTVKSGAYVANNGTIDIDGTGEEALLIAKENSHIINNGEIYTTTSGLIEGLEYITDGPVIENCDLERVDGNDSYWYYTGSSGDNCVYAKTVLTSSEKVTWAMDSAYSSYATLSSKKNSLTATLTPKKLTAATEIWLTATYEDTKVAHIRVLLKPAATKISVYGNGENLSGKTQKISIDYNNIPFSISVTPEDAYCSVTASSKNFYVVKKGQYIALFKDQDTYEDYKKDKERDGHREDYIAAVVELNGEGGTLYILNKEYCKDEDTGAGKTFTLTAASAKVKTSVNVSFVEYGDSIVFDCEDRITGGDKLVLSAYFANKSKSDTILWEFDGDDSTEFASLKTVKGITTLTTKKVTENTEIHIRAYSANNEGCSDTLTVTLHPAATSAQIYRDIENNEWVDSEPLADKAKITVLATELTEKEYKLSAALKPCGNSYALWDKVVYASSNNNVIKVVQDSQNPEKATLIYQGKTGSAKITLSYKNAANKVIKTSSVTFNVIAPVEISFTEDSISMHAGESALIKANITGTYASNKLVWSIQEDYLSDWVSLKPSKEKCTVTVKAGCEWQTFHVIVKSSETDEISATIPVYVEPAKSSILLYANITDTYGTYEKLVSGTSYIMSAGEEISIEKICVIDENGDTRWIEKGQRLWNSIVWSSSAAKTATLDGYGLVTAVAKGTSKITVSYDGIRGEFTVNVGNYADSIEIRPVKDIPAVSGKTAAFAAYDCDTGKKVNAVFSIVSGSEYASVSASGTLKAVTGLSNRKYVCIKAVCKDARAAEAYYNVQIVPAVTNMMLYTKLGESDSQYSNGKTFNLDVVKTKDADDKTIYVHESVQLMAGQYPSEAYYDPQYKLPSGVTMDSQGFLTFAKPGSYTIKVTAGDGSGKSAQVKFNVQRAVDTIDAADTEVMHGKSIKLSCTLNRGGEAPKNKNVTWSLLYPTDEKYCTLTAAGKFTANANAAGRQVKVVVTAQDNGLKDIITVTIK